MTQHGARYINKAVRAVDVKPQLGTAPGNAERPKPRSLAPSDGARLNSEAFENKVPGGFSVKQPPHKTQYATST